MTIPGPYIMVNDISLAREFLDPVQKTHVENMASSQITVAGAHGQGWRSKLVETKVKEAKPRDSEEHSESLITGVSLCPATPNKSHCAKPGTPRANSAPAEAGLDQGRQGHNTEVEKVTHVQKVETPLSFFGSARSERN